MGAESADGYFVNARNYSAETTRKRANVIVSLVTRAFFILEG